MDNERIIFNKKEKLNLFFFSFLIQMILILTRFTHLYVDMNVYINKMKPFNDRLMTDMSCTLEFTYKYIFFITLLSSCRWLCNFKVYSQSMDQTFQSID
jgi:hypothetical protein